MKVIILLGDGMSDELYSELGNKSPLQSAQTPNMDFMARNGRVGLAHTVPDGLPPGSDVANLSVQATQPMRAELPGRNLGPVFHESHAAIGKHRRQ